MLKSYFQGYILHKLCQVSIDRLLLVWAEYKSMNIGILQNEYKNLQWDVIQLEAGCEVLLLSVHVEHSDSYFTLLILMTTNQGLEHFSNN